MDKLIIIVAIFGAAIAWAQWYTARSKLALDLFSQRLEVYNATGAVMAKVLREGNADVAEIAAFSVPQDRARFLFGDDVNDYMQAMRKTLADLACARTIVDMLEGDERYQKAVEQKYACLSRV